MSNVFANISGALDTHLDDMVGRPPVAWENKKYAPTIGELYLRPVNMQGETVAITSEQDETVGVYEIEIFAPANEGKEESVATVTCNNEFVGPALAGDLICGVAEVTRRGGSLVFVRAVLSVEERVILTSSAVIKRLRPKH